MAKQYSKREFLRILGLGMVMLPFISCYDLEDKRKRPQNKLSGAGGKKIKMPEIEVTDNDILLLSRNDNDYATFNTAFNKRIKKFPRYIAVCKTEKGVQYAIQKARTEGLKIAVKSGGHSFEGFSSNDGGIVIDLSLMKQITWLENNEVEVQPGCLLQDIQDAFFPKKRLLPAGSCGTVGISGLTLGGGYGFFSRKYGLTCDNLLQVKMITADGQIYNSDEHQELLWACKGGGNGNFGVITSFKFKTYEMPPFFDSYVLKFRNLDAAKAGYLLDTWFACTEKLPAEAFSAFVLNGKTLTVLITNYKSHPDFERLFDSLIALADSYNPQLHQDLPKALKKYYGRKGPLYFKNASGGMYRGKADLDDIKIPLIQQVMDQSGLIFQINTLGGKVNDKAFEAASCFPHRQLPYLSELQAYWDQESQEKERTDAFEHIQKLIRENGITAHYRNYPDIYFEDWALSYYGSNYPRLQQIKKQYDPEDVFHYPQSIRLN